VDTRDRPADHKALDSEVPSKIVWIFRVTVPALDRVIRHEAGASEANPPRTGYQNGL
jgi:hypothetical protein